MCMLCEYWDNQSGGCKIHNTVPGGCKDFRSIINTDEIQKLHAKISEMQNTIDCLTAENTKLYKELQESTLTDNLPYEPIAVAEMLINAKTEELRNIKERIECARECFATGEAKPHRVYSNLQLRQIAERLLVYCNNNKDEG